MAKRVRVQKPKLTANQAAFEKERRRLMRGVRRWEREGFIFPEGFAIDRPARVTKKRLQQIRELKPADLLRFATAVGEGGEIISGEIAYQERRRESIRKGQRTRRLNEIRHRTLPDEMRGEVGITGEAPSGPVTSLYFVYTEFIQRMSEEPDPHRPRNAVELSRREQNTILSLTDREVSRVGEAVVGDRLEALRERIWDLVGRVLHDSEEANIMTASMELTTAILGRAVTISERLDLGEESEANETWEEY